MHSLTARIRTTDGWHAGKTVESIVRREYGRTATIRWSADRNSPEAGMIVKTGPHGTTVVTSLIYAEGKLDNGDSITTPKRAGDRVHYIVAPFNLPDELIVGEIVNVGPDGYAVYWDGIDRDVYPAVVYGDADIVPAG